MNIPILSSLSKKNFWSVDKSGFDSAGVRKYCPVQCRQLDSASTGSDTTCERYHFQFYTDKFAWYAHPKHLTRGIHTDPLNNRMSELHGPKCCSLHDSRGSQHHIFYEHNHRNGKSRLACNCSKIWISPDQVSVIPERFDVVTLSASTKRPEAQNTCDFKQNHEGDFFS